MKNKIIWAIVILIVGLAAYSVFMDDYGQFDPPESLDHAAYRLGRDIQGGASEVKGEVQETNEEMQGVVNDRTRRNDRKIARDKAGQ